MNDPPLDRGCVAIRQRALEYVDDGHLAVFEALPRDGSRWLLDSAHRHARLGRYSFAGSDPYAVLRAFEDRIEVDRRRAPLAGRGPQSLPEENAGDPLAVLRALAPSVSRERIDWPAELPEGLPFVGGAIGCLGYALGALTEDLALSAADDLEVPELSALLVDRLVAWDHVARRAWVIGLGFADDADEARGHAEAAADAQRQAFDEVVVDPALRRARLARAVAPDPLRDRQATLATAVPECADTGLDRDAYLDRVEALCEEIERGNVYEVNLTRRLSLPFDGDPWRLYLALRARNPAPFACYLELDDGVVLGSSPERFLRVGPDGGVESRPIKGTRPRGATPECDDALEKELASSEKDRAENLMIVDLVRNDLGRVCEIGSVNVPELMQIEAYASVFQLVSSVTGRLARGRDRVDLIRAAFPPGSMTGAPKRAAMQLIDRMEPSQRGLYSGAIGYLDLRGGMDLSVVIRTMFVRRGRVHLDVGGAIVADSDPSAEYDETIDKARALLAALADLESPDARAG